MTMLNAHGQPRRHRRCQLSVPASNTKMIQKASESGVDHVFLDLEDACAPNQKVGARDNVIDAFKQSRLGRYSAMCSHQRYRHPVVPRRRD